jgi:hypothetical protein
MDSMLRAHHAVNGSAQITNQTFDIKFARLSGANFQANSGEQWN